MLQELRYKHLRCELADRADGKHVVFTTKANKRFETRDAYTPEHGRDMLEMYETMAM